MDQNREKFLGGEVCIIFFFVNDFSMVLIMGGCHDNSPSFVTELLVLGDNNTKITTTFTLGSGEWPKNLGEKANFLSGISDSVAFLNQNVLRKKKNF